VNERHKIELSRFTSIGTYLREIEELLEAGERLELVIPVAKKEQFELEVENWRALGKVKIRFV
jgi:hypothetical protein